MHAVCDFLKPEHFADALNGRIFAEQRRRILAGGIADAVTLKTWFEADPDYEAAGGFAYLAGLTCAYVGPGTAGPYGRAIYDAAVRRRVIAAGEDIVNAAFTADAEPIEIAARAIASVEAAVQAEGDTRTASLDEAMASAIAAADEASKRRGPAGVPTGFQSIDERLGGLENGTLTVLAGRPGMGKSALGWQIALNAARSGVGVLVFSLEMSATELGRRALAIASGVQIGTMKHGTMTSEEASRMVGAQREMTSLPLTIEDGGGLTPGLIALKAKAVRRRHPVGLIVVDHLHIVAPEAADARQGPTHAIGQISIAMKRLAKDMRCPVLLLAQLNRGVEARDDKRPSLGDLRQSGGIEQDADAVMFVYRPEYYVRKPETREGDTPEKAADRARAYEREKARWTGVAELIIAKVRDGETGDVRLRYHGPTTCFHEQAP